MVSNSSLVLLKTSSDIVMTVSLQDFSGRVEESVNHAWRACKKQCKDGAEKDISKVEYVVLFVCLFIVQEQQSTKLEGDIFKLTITSSMLLWKSNSPRAMNLIDAVVNVRNNSKSVCTHKEFLTSTESTDKIIHCFLWDMQSWLLADSRLPGIGSFYQIWCDVFLQLIHQLRKDTN